MTKRWSSVRNGGPTKRAASKKIRRTGRYNETMVKKILAAKNAKAAFVTDDPDEFMRWLEKGLARKNNESLFSSREYEGEKKEGEAH